MTNLTPSEARRLIDKLHHNQTKEHGISMLEEKYLAALEIALPVLEQQEKSEMDFIRMRELLKNNQTDTYRQIENDGWIEWKGDRALPPVEVDALVEVRLRGGETIKREAKYFAWSNGVGNRSYDIIAYRVIENNGREG